MAIDDLHEEEPVTGNGLPQLGGKGVPVGAPSSPSEKKVLNVSSKKKNHMATIANAGTEPSWYPIDLTAGSNGLGLASTLWCATFRHQFTGNGNPGQSREKNQVYWKGIKEKITVRTDTNAPVRWRRIVFENPVLPDMTNVPTGSYLAYTALPEKGAIPDDNDQGATYAYYRPFKSQGDLQRVLSKI